MLSLTSGDPRLPRQVGLSNATYPPSGDMAGYPASILGDQKYRLKAVRRPSALVEAVGAVVGLNPSSRAVKGRKARPSDECEPECSANHAQRRPPWPGCLVTMLAQALGLP